MFRPPKTTEGSECELLKAYSSIRVQDTIAEKTLLDSFSKRVDADNRGGQASRPCLSLDDLEFHKSCSKLDVARTNGAPFLPTLACANNESGSSSYKWKSSVNREAVPEVGRPSYPISRNHNWVHSLND